MTVVLFLSFVLLVTGAVVYRSWSKRQAFEHRLATPLSSQQRALLAAQVPLIRKLPDEVKGKLEGKIQAFLHQVEFIGRGGLDVTEEMELSIAAQACLLVVNTDAWYDHLRTILIYPGAFKSKTRESDGFVVVERETVRLGESWPRGPVILSWAHSEHGALNNTDGHNVVLHEFAHQLDNLSGRTDGAPVLNEGQSFAAWERIFVEAFEAHVQDVEHGRPTVLDPYGAQGPEEFFAVAVELFFERPLELKNDNAAVYAQLSALFQMDPATWV